MKKLVLFLAAVCCAAMMQAETILTDVKYIDANGVEQTCPSATVVFTNGRVTWKEGWYVIAGTVTISGGIICNGAVHLILGDGRQLRVYGGEEIGTAGIEVSGEGNSLTIYGQKAQSGQLIVSGVRTGGAGIGGGEYCSGSNITINGGTVTADGGAAAAGIGGGHGGSASNITINGGIVTATGGAYGAGIGGGQSGSGFYITINGGTVMAIGDECAGIGSGDGGGESSYIFAADSVKVIANGSVITHTSSKDIASDLAGKNNVTAFDLAPFIKAINQAVGGSTDATIVELADVAKASVLVQTTADRAKAVSDLAVAKINALKEILPLIGDDANARNTEFISNIISNIGSAISENDITTTKAQALITVPAYLTGRSSALGTMGTKQDGPAIEVKGNDASTIKLYNIKNVKFGKETTIE